MKEHSYLAWPLYLTGLVIVAFPALEYVLTIWPLSPGILSWRFGSVGLLARSIFTPLVGLVVLLATATVLGHVWVKRAVMALGFAGSVVLLLALAMFALDLIQFRVQVRAASRTAYDVSSVMTVLKLLAGTAVLLAFGLNGLRELRHERRRARHGEPPLLVGSRTLEHSPPSA